MTVQQDVREISIDGLINARALETEAIQLMTPQVERLENYPEMESALNRHIAESETQRKRLDA